MAARAECAEAPATVAIEQLLRDDAARGIARADEQDRADPRVQNATSVSGRANRLAARPCSDGRLGRAPVGRALAGGQEGLPLDALRILDPALLALRVTADGR